MQKTQEIITSKQNSLVMLTASLAERKYRKKEGLFRFDGKKLLAEALDASLPLFAVLLRVSTAEELLAELGSRSFPQECRTVLVSDEVFGRLSEEKAPEGVIAVSAPPRGLHCTLTGADVEELDRTLVRGRTLVLESVRDPGNLGTIVRSAKAFGIDNLLLSSDCADLYHSRTIRAAMGALFRQRVCITEDPVGAIRYLAGRGRVYAAALDHKAARLGEITFGAEDAVVVGNEGHGLSLAAKEACTDCVLIPMREGVESLNAGVAASVLLWELFRGR